MFPRERHLKAIKRILSYLETFPKGKNIVETSYPDHSIYPFKGHSNWMEFYPDAEEKIANDLLTSKGSKVS